ncbi:MAG: hypothetical protein ACREKJ_13520 [Candidatus Rokuibacteriota bacterium]
MAAGASAQSPGTEEYYRAGGGVDGDPTRATAELGRPDVELIVSRTVDAVRKSITHR